VRSRANRRNPLLVLVLTGALAWSSAIAGAATTPTGKVPRLIFPVLGPASYTDDFGDPRGSGRHEGNDLMAPRRALAVAAEAGTVSFYTGSARAGCMLTLRGDSGTHYVYIHLNDDLTANNDNRGKCAPGVAYAPRLKSGARVRAGDPVGYVGNSGDADATAPHLHFEMHPGGGAAVSPFAHLRKARKLLFAARLGSHATLTLRGNVVAAANGSLRMRVQTLRRWPGGLLVRPARVVDLALPNETVAVDATGAFVAASRLAGTKPATRVTVTSDVAAVTLAAALGSPRALTAHAVALDP
jgi:hypothetical protein